MRVCYSFEVRSRDKLLGVLLLRYLRSMNICSLIDYIAISGTMERNVLEFADHLHEHFVTPCSINSKGRYNVPDNSEEGYRYELAFYTQGLILILSVQYRNA